jgi:hypothetical protein
MLPKCLDKPIAAVIADPVVDNRSLHGRRFHDLRTNQVAVSVAAHVATHTTAPCRFIATVYLARQGHELCQLKASEIDFPVARESNLV